jgi:hypothetical protein
VNEVESAPVILMLVKFRTEVPALVSVTVLYSDVVFSTADPNAIKVVLSVTEGTAVPVPLSVAVCGVPVALSATLSVAVTAAAVAGLNATVTEQDAPEASVAPQSFNSTNAVGVVPANEMVFIVAETLPVFLMLIVCASLTEPITVFGNTSEAGVRVIIGTGVATVTETSAEVEPGYVLLPENVAEIELAPTFSAVPATVTEQVPELSVQLPSAVDPETNATVPANAGISPVKPTGVPPATVAVSFVDAVVKMEVGDAAALVVLVNALSQLVIRLYTLTLPNPVARSKPGPAL